MPKSKPCELLAIIVADRVFREEGTRKVHISGTFSEIQAIAFPCRHPSMHLYVALTDARTGPHKGRIRFAYLDETQTEVLSSEGPLRVSGPLEVLELNAEFPNVLFPKEGTLAIEFWMDDVLIGSRKIGLTLAAGKRDKAG